MREKEKSREKEKERERERERKREGERGREGEGKRDILLVKYNTGSSILCNISFWHLNSAYLEKYCLLSNYIDSRGHFGSFWGHFGNAFPQW